jgi:aspartyl protease family protein
MLTLITAKSRSESAKRKIAQHSQTSMRKAYLNGGAVNLRNRFAINKLLPLSLMLLMTSGCTAQDTPWLKEVFWLILLSSSLFFYIRTQPGTVLKSLLIWAVIIIFFVLVYSFRDIGTILQNRLSAELFPTHARNIDEKTIALKRAQDGHFHVRTTINNKEVEMLVDTGATIVLLDYKTAKNLGIDVENLKFSSEFQTANGISYGAAIRIREIQIENIVLNDVRAAVTRADIGSQLFGMSALSKFYRYEIKGDTLTLYQ